MVDCNATLRNVTANVLETRVNSQVVDVTRTGNFRIMKDYQGRMYLAEEIRYEIVCHDKDLNYRYSRRSYEWEEVSVLYFVMSKVKAWVKWMRGH